MMFVRGSSDDSSHLDIVLVEVIDKETLSRFDHPEIIAGGRAYPRIRPVYDLLLVTPYDELSKIPPVIVEGKTVMIDLGEWDAEKRIAKTIKKILIYVANCRPKNVKATSLLLNADYEENTFYEYNEISELYAVSRHRNIRPVRRGRTIRN